MKKKYKKISVGGMIGTGKSVCAKHISEKLNYKMVDEFDPNDKVFNFMLNELYEGNTDVAFMLQSGFLKNSYVRYNEHECNLVTDRDLAEHWIFANLNITCPHQKAAYNSMFWSFYETHWKPDLYLILDCSWDTIQARIIKRGRKSEVDNFEKNKDYFKELNNTYVKKIKGFCDLNNIKTLLIDAEKDGFYDMIKI